MKLSDPIALVTKSKEENRVLSVAPDQSVYEAIQKMAEHGTPPAVAGFMKALLALLQFVFGCRHRHLSRVFTIKHRTYKICFDCGREFDLPDALTAGPSNIS